MGIEPTLYGDSMPLAERLRGMRECLAYIRKEALTYRLDAVADCLNEACEEIDLGLAGLTEPVDWPIGQRWEE